MYSTISNPMVYHAALYARLSRDDEREGASQSIANQISLLKDFSSTNRLSVYNTYVDDGFSGTSFDRPAFKQMIQDIEAHKVNMVITKDLSRLGRDYILTGHYMERFFPEHQVRYISLLDGIDTGTESAANDITPFRAIMNDMYAKDISKKVKSVKHNKQQKGYFIGGKPPYGYKAHPDGKFKFVIDEEAASIVKRIFSMALDGTSCRKIAGTLNAEQIPSPSTYAGVKIGRRGPYSGLWSSERISAMLQNEVYIGNMVQGRTVSVSYKSKKYIKLPKEQWIVVPHTHEPIIDPETFQKVGELIRCRNHIRCRSYDYLLKGLIYCHECGYPLGVMNCAKADHAENLYFICRTYQRFSTSGVCTCHCCNVDEITKAVLQKIQDVCSSCLVESDLLSAARQVMEKEKSYDPISIEANAVRSKLDAMANNLEQMYSDRLEGVLAPEDFRRLYEKLKIQRDQLQQRLVKLQRRQKVSATANIDARELARRFMQEGPCSRELLTALVQRIELSEDRELYIQFRFKNMNSKES